MGILARAIIAAGLLVGASPAVAQDGAPPGSSTPIRPSPPHVVVMSGPDWIQRPTALVYPRAAQRARVSGAARMTCEITDEGLLVHCEVVSESPPGYGFGQAALDMAGQFRMRIPAGGPALGGKHVVIPFRFQLPGDSGPPLPAPLSNPAGAAPDTPGLGAERIDRPHWVRRPDGDDVARVYPNPAYRSGVGGHVVMVCKVTADGSLTDCKVRSEQPVDFAFGVAAMNLAPKFKMSPTTADGKSVAGATVVIPITFQPPAP